MTLCGEPKPSSGSIWFEGEQIDSLSTARIMRKDIAVVPEGRRIFARLTVEENLLMGAFFVDKAEQRGLLDQIFTLFPRLHERLEQRAGTMSGGEQQRLAPIVIQQIFDTIEQLRRDGMTIFLVEQNANQALKLADRGYVLENGHVVLQDTGAALLANPAVRQAYLGG